MSTGLPTMPLSLSSNESKASLDIADNDQKIHLKRGYLKIDLVVVPIATILYLLSYLDRTNIGNARVAGFQKDLGLTNTQYSMALTTTFIPYIAFEVPCNLLTKRVGAHITLPIMMMIWGAANACQGVVRSYGGLLACRFVLGAAESGLATGLVFYLSTFYRRQQLQFRLAIMFSASSLAGAFSGLLAAAIQNMQGVRGKTGWAWIFILEGTLTSFVGVLVAFIMPHRPSTFGHLSQQEKRAVLQVLDSDWEASSANEKFAISQAFACFRQPHLWILTAIYFLTGTLLYGLGYFSPSIINALGNSPTRSQLLSVAPWSCACVASITSSYFGDRYRQRGLVNIIAALVALSGYILFHSTSNKHAEYGALFLQTMGAFSASPASSAWLAVNFQPQYKRAVAIATAYMALNCGGILAVWLFDDPPAYRRATRVNIAFSAAIIVLSGVNMVYLRYRNNEKERFRRMLFSSKDEGVTSMEEKDRVGRLGLGDQSPMFIYSL